MSEEIEISEKIEINSILEGSIIKIKPFGAIVELPGNNQGLVHISHISGRFVQNVTDFVNIGDSVLVKVIDIEPESGKISLSMKDAEVSASPKIEPLYSNNSKYDNYSSPGSTFEDKFKEWVKISNERQAGLNKRNKRR